MKTLITLTGPSCAGKSTLEKILQTTYGFARVISTTTRPMRFGDVDGVHYYFVSREYFLGLRAAGGFIESVEFGGNLYGMTVAELDRVASEGRPICLVCEPDGAGQIRSWHLKNRDWKLVQVFIDGSPEIIAKRIVGRLFDEVGDILDGDLGEMGWSGPMMSLRATYMKRLGVMMGEEREWSRDAEWPGKYDATFKDFTESSQGMVINRILRMCGMGYTPCNTGERTIGSDAKLAESAG